MILLIKGGVKVAGHMRGGSFVNPHVRRAVQWSAQQHRGQTRKDGKTPYIQHPIAVARSLEQEGGVTDEDVIIASLLHDVIEDTGATRGQVANLFGERVAGIVSELTKDPNATQAEQKQAEIDKDWSPEAGVVKIGDKLSNIRDVISAPPVDWDYQKRLRFLSHALAVVEAMKSPNPAMVAAFMQQYREGVERMRSAGI